MENVLLLKLINAISVYPGEIKKAEEQMAREASDLFKEDCYFNIAEKMIFKKNAADEFEYRKNLYVIKMQSDKIDQNGNTLDENRLHPTLVVEEYIEGYPFVGLNIIEGEQEYKNSISLLHHKK